MQIDDTNYEVFFLRYVDGELDAAGNREVESFAAKHPGPGRELALLRLTVSQPSLAVLADKSPLYREEKKDRAVVWYLWRAAAVIAVLLSGVWFYGARVGTRKSTDTEKPVANTTIPKKIPATQVYPKGTAAGSGSPKAASTADAQSARLAKTARPVRTVAATKIFAAAGQGEVAATETAPFPENRAKHALPAVLPETGRGSAGPELSEIPPPVVMVPQAFPLSAGPQASQQPVVTTMAALPGNGGNAGAATASAAPGTETASGDEAVSILAFRRKGGIRKLIGKLSGGDGGRNSLAENNDRSVNISVFAFAVRKKSTE